MRAFLCLLLALGCRGGRIEIVDAATLAAACEQGEPETILLEVSFAAAPAGGCRWGEDGNLPPTQGVVAARTEQVQILDVPDDMVVCDLTFDFQPDPSVEQIIRYDDNFFLAFSDVVLAASYGPLVEVFERDEAGLPLWDWEALAGTPFEFRDVEPYCLGEEEGASECVVPPPETPGPIALDLGGELVAQLSYHAIEREQYDFRFVAIGDNDPQLDCQHDAFSFLIEAPAIAR